MPKYDVIVVGSGLAGVHAAYPSVENGLSVALVDVGHAGVAEKNDTRSFEEIRRGEAEQYKIFLGDDLSGIDLGQGHFRSMVSGRRSYVVEGAEKYAPLSHEGLDIPQSFARGGFSEAWSGISELFDAPELEAVGLPQQEMNQNYQAVATRIGLSGASKDLALQKPPRMDEQAKQFYEKYRANEEAIRKAGFFVEQPLYAMQTEEKNGRIPQTYRDMDFWDNSGKVVYRASYTLEELIKRDNFSYISGSLALSFEESSEEVKLVVRDLKSGSMVSHVARTLVLAAGAINTTRLVLRSSQSYDRPTPILLKKHYIVPCLFLSRLGKRGDVRRHSFAQLAMHGLSRTSGMNEIYGQLVGYNSLLLSKLVRYAPLPVPEAFRAIAILAPALMFADFRFPSISDDRHNVTLLKKETGDELLITYPDESEQRQRQDALVKKAKKALRKLGLIPLMTERHGYNMQSHYAGGVHVSEKGILQGHERVYVADSAGWKALPAKPSGLSIMANANRIGLEVSRFLAH